MENEIKMIIINKNNISETTRKKKGKKFIQLVAASMKFCFGEINYFIYLKRYVTGKQKPILTIKRKMDII